MRSYWYFLNTLCTSKADVEASSDKHLGYNLSNLCIYSVYLKCFAGVFFSTESELYKDVAVLPNEQDLVREEAQKMSSLLPTMWLGAQNGW